MCVCRFYALLPREVQSCEGVEAGEAKQLPKKKKMDIGPQLPKPLASKSSAKQHISGEASCNENEYFYAGYHTHKCCRGLISIVFNKHKYGWCYTSAYFVVSLNIRNNYLISPPITHDVY